MKKYFNLKQSDMRKQVSRQDKQQFTKDGRDGRPNVLIDDHLGNIKEFRSKVVLEFIIQVLLILLIN